MIKPQLRKVRGVAEVNTWGGFEKQYHVVTEPERLVKHGLTLEQLFEALEANNQNVGGGQVVRSGESLLVQGLGLTTNVEEIANIVITAHDGVPVRVQRRGHRAGGPRNPARRGDRRGQGRNRAGAGLHAHGREQRTS